MGLWSRNKKQTKPISVSLDDLSKTKNTPTLQIGSIKGTRSFQHLDSIKYSQKESNPYKFADESFQRISSLGSGAYSTVTKVLHYPTNTIMAKKIIKIGSKEDSNSLSETQILRELNILAKCQCNYIVTYYGTFISNHQINIMMEYMDIGSLEYIIKKLGAVPMPPMKTITLHSLRGLLYLEEQGIIHRDIKPANILLNSLGEAKLADFGLGKDVYGSVAKSCVGTIAYLAPENLEKRMGYDTIITHKSDIWSLGLTLLECILGRFPHETDNLYDNNNRISLEEIPSLKQVTTKEFLEFCSLCLTKNQETRTSAKDLAVLLINKETDFILDSISSPFDLKGWLLEEQFVKVNKVE